MLYKIDLICTTEDIGYDALERNHKHHIVNLSVFQADMAARRGYCCLLKLALFKNLGADFTDISSITMYWKRLGQYWSFMKSLCGTKIQFSDFFARHISK